jgi:hypothetical protein
VSTATRRARASDAGADSPALATIRPTRRAALTLALAALAGAGCQEHRRPPPPQPISSPIPERAGGSVASRPEEPPPPEAGLTVTPARLLDGPQAARFTTPGRARWIVELSAPITFLRWSPLTGLVVSAGPDVENVTSWGQRRWRVVAGAGHRLFAAGEDEILWSPQFQRLSQIRRWGRIGWQRTWSGELVGDQVDGVFMVDAATVAAIGDDGKDRWRASLEGLRRIEGPYPCDGGTVFHGIRGLEGVAVTISTRGAVMRETVLERGAVVLAAGPDCAPLVWQGDELSLLDTRGLGQWRHPFPAAPIVQRLPGGFLLASHRAGAAVRLTAIRDGGEVAWSQELPVSGRLTHLGALPADDLRARAVGLCLDVSSPCARPAGDRGPFNALLTPAADGTLRVLERHTGGHLGLAAHPAGGYVMASSQSEELTELTLRGERDVVQWQVTLPGRLSAGPYVGPDGEVYVGTCQGWGCAPPYRLIAVTGVEPAPEPRATSPGEESPP